jgi:hypothetical protein
VAAKIDEFWKEPIRLGIPEYERRSLFPASGTVPKTNGRFLCLAAFWSLRDDGRSTNLHNKIIDENIPLEFDSEMC